MYKLNKEKALTSDMIQKYIEKNRAKDAELKKLYDYYVGKHDIQKRTMGDISKPNNKVVNPYAHYITDMFCGYFMGEPVQYSANDKELLEVIQAIYNYNDEAANNAEIAKDASIFGSVYEIMYLDDEAQVRFKKLGAVGCIPIFENTIESELLYFIRYYDEEDIVSGNVITYVEVYSRYEINTYILGLGGLTLLENKPHSWGLVPIVIYENNEEGLGDFATVISLIDAYDKMESDSINDTEYFNDCYLVLSGMQGTDADDIAETKKNRVFLLPEDGKAEWLTKQINDTYLENEKTRLDNDIHKFSYCPAMTDKDFAANASGVAMKYKLMGLEQATAKKERAFKKGLQRRLELICNILKVMGSDYDYRSVSMIFTRNIPVNIVEMADVINKVAHLYSKKTQMGMLPIEVDYEAEQLQIAQEQENAYSIDFTDDEGEVEE